MPPEIAETKPGPEVLNPPSTETTTESTKTETSAPETEVDGKSLLNQDGKAEPKAGAPEAYADFTVPEGFTLDEAVATEAGALFKGMNLTQPQAQSLVDFYVSKTAAAAQAPYDAYASMREGWRSEIKADPVIGGKLDQVKADVARAIDGLGDAKLATDFRAAMDLTGAGDHPAFIRAFHKLAQKVIEGGHVSGRGPAPVQSPTGSARSAAHALYPDLK